jgi:hypothetical protein
MGMGGFGDMMGGPGFVPRLDNSHLFISNKNKKKNELPEPMMPIPHLPLKFYKKGRAPAHLIKYE